MNRDVSWHVQVYFYWVAGTLTVYVAGMSVFLAAIMLVVLPARGNDWAVWSFVIGGTTGLVWLMARLRALLRGGQRQAAAESSRSALHPPPWPLAGVGVVLSCAWALLGIAAAVAGDVWLAATAIGAALIVGTGSVSGFAWAWSAGREQRMEIPLGIALAGVSGCCLFWLLRFQPPPALTIHCAASAAASTLILGSWLMAAAPEERLRPCCHHGAAPKE